MRNLTHHINNAPVREIGAILSSREKKPLNYLCTMHTCAVGVEIF